MPFISPVKQQKRSLWMDGDDGMNRLVLFSPQNSYYERLRSLWLSQHKAFCQLRSAESVSLCFLKLQKQNSSANFLKPHTHTHTAKGCFNYSLCVHVCPWDVIQLTHRHLGWSCVSYLKLVSIVYCFLFFFHECPKILLVSCLLQCLHSSIIIHLFCRLTLFLPPSQVPKQQRWSFPTACTK